MTKKEEFIEIYRKEIHREGADKLLAWLEKTDFFTARPAHGITGHMREGWRSTASMFLSGCGRFADWNPRGKQL